MDGTATIERANQVIDDPSSVEDELLSQLEKEEIPSHIREARLQTLKQQSSHFQQLRDLSFGQYTLIPDEKSFLDLTTSSLVAQCVVHFFHPDFRRCAIVDKHFETLSKKYFKTKFAKINVERSNFLVLKLKVQMLPAILCFKSSMVVDRIIGFEELGNTDDFSLTVLERRLAKS
ncbi:CCT complex interacting protein, partial [Bulinus truncatus]